MVQFNNKTEQLTRQFHKFKFLIAAFSGGFLILLAAFQVTPFSHTVDVGHKNDNSFVANFYEPEKNADFDYRWSRAESYVNLYQVGTPYKLSFQALTANPELPSVNVQVLANGELGQVGWPRPADL